MQRNNEVTNDGGHVAGTRGFERQRRPGPHGWKGEGVRGVASGPGVPRRRRGRASRLGDNACSRVCVLRDSTQQRSLRMRWPRETRGCAGRWVGGARVPTWTGCARRERRQGPFSHAAAGRASGALSTRVGQRIAAGCTGGTRLIARGGEEARALAARLRPVDSATRYVDYLQVDVGDARDHLAHSIKSRWVGEGAKVLGHTGPVGPRALSAVLRGRVPGGSQRGRRHKPRRLGRRRGGKWEHRPGLDLTFSPPKSVSILALLGSDGWLMAAHEGAARRTLERIESEYVETRKSDPKTRRTVRVGGQKMVAATFLHVRSRELDPHIHTHSIIANAVLGDDGKWRTMANEKIYTGGRRINAFYLAELAGELEPLGYRLRTTDSDGGFEIEGVPHEVIEAFSKRRTHIEEERRRRASRGDATPADVVARKTRPPKRAVDSAVLESEWQHRASELGFSAEVVVAGARERSYRPADSGGAEHIACGALTEPPLVRVAAERACAGAEPDRPRALRPRRTAAFVTDRAVHGCRGQSARASPCGDACAVRPFRLAPRGDAGPAPGRRRRRFFAWERAQLQLMRALERRFARSCGGAAPCGSPRRGGPGANRARAPPRTPCSAGARSSRRSRASPRASLLRATMSGGGSARRAGQPVDAPQGPMDGGSGISVRPSVSTGAVGWRRDCASVAGGPSPPAQIPRHDDGRSQRRVVPPWTADSLNGVDTRAHDRYHPE